jgi:hypothetical protein
MTQPPNLIYLFADQLRYQSRGFAGDAKAQTPNMEQLAAESVNFINATSSHPMCAPYRADGSELLFDNLADPFQMQNLAADPHYANRLQQMRGLLQRRLAALNDTFECCTWYRDHWTEDRIIQRTATTP